MVNGTKIRERNSGYGSIHTGKRDDDRAEAKETNKAFFAYGLLIGSMALQCISVSCVQVLGGALPEFNLNAWRFGINTLLVLPIIISKKCDVRAPRKVWPHLIALFVWSNIFNITYYEAAVFLPVGTAFAFMSSIIIAGNAILSICMKSERKLALYLGALTVIIGLLLITQPELIFPGTLGILPSNPPTNWTSPCLQQVPMLDNSTVIEIESDKTWLGYLMVSIAGVAGLFFTHFIAIIVKHISPFVYTFWISIACTIISIILSASLEAPVWLTDPACIGLLLGHAVGTSQITIIFPWCLQHLSPTVGAMVNSFQLVVLLILQYTVLKDIQPGHGNWLEILGAVLVFAGVIGGPLWHLLQQRKADLQVAKHKDSSNLE